MRSYLWKAEMSDTILKGATQAPSQTKLVQRFRGGERERFKCHVLSKYA